VQSPPPARAHPPSLHDALPIWSFVDRHDAIDQRRDRNPSRRSELEKRLHVAVLGPADVCERIVVAFELVRRVVAARATTIRSHRSEEHTSELQSPYDLVCRLLL